MGDLAFLQHLHQLTGWLIGKMKQMSAIYCYRDPVIFRHPRKSFDGKSNEISGFLTASHHEKGLGGECV
jgi:hypothetical protein